MVKLAALIAALPVTALCVVVALYAARLSVLVLTHWQAQIGISVLLYLLPMLLVVLRRRRQAKRQPSGEDSLRPAIRRPLREL